MHCAKTIAPILDVHLARNDPLGVELFRPSKPPPHELSDEEIFDIADKIVSGHSSDKHRIEQKEFPELGSDLELEAHVAEVMKKHTEWKRLRNGRNAYWHQNSGTTVIDDPLGEGTVLRPKRGKEYFNEL